MRNDYGKASVGHNVLILDGCGQAEGTIVAKQPLASWATTIVQKHNTGVGSVEFDRSCLGKSGRGTDNHTRGLVHRRVAAGGSSQSSFWLVVDRVAADGAKPLGVNALWHAAPNALVTVLSTTGHLWARIETCSHGHRTTAKM